TARKNLRSFQSNMAALCNSAAPSRNVTAPQRRRANLEFPSGFSCEPLMENGMNAIAPFDAEKFKAATRDQWDKSAKGWNDQSTRIRTWLRESTDAMLEMAEIRPGARVLDVAAGAGDQTLDIAKRVGSSGSVLATDLSPAILELAKDNARHAGYDNVETQVADGEDLRVPEASFDAAVCRLGLMFFPDPARGLREMFRAL